MNIKISTSILSEKDQETLKNLAEELNGLPFELVVDEPRQYIDKPDTETMRKLSDRYESLRPYLHLLPLLEKNKEGKLAFTEEGKQRFGYGYESNAESKKHMDLIWQNMCFEEVGENSKKNPADAAAKVRLNLEKFIRVLVSSKHALYLSEKHVGQRRGELYIYDYDQKRAYSLNSSEGWGFLKELYYSVGRDSSQREKLTRDTQDAVVDMLHARAENLMPYPEVQPHEVKCADGIFNTITRTFTPYSYLYPQHLRIAASYHVDATEQERKKVALFLQQLLKDIASLDPLQLENMTDKELEKAQEDRLNRLKNIFVLLTAVATGYTRQEAIFLAVGGAGTGKSTLSKMCTNMIGAENCSSVPISAMDDHNQLGTMVGKIANISSDEEEGHHQKNFMTLKSIVSSEPITINRKYLESINVRLSNVVAQFANDVVRLGKGHASADRRIAFISLTNGAGNRGEGALPKEDVQRYVEGNDPLVSSLLLGMVLGQETLRNKVDFTDFHIYREEKGEKQQIVRFVADHLAVKHDEEAEYPLLSNPGLQVLPVALLYCIYKEWVKTEDSGIQMTLNSFTKEVKTELEHYGFKLQTSSSTLATLENKEELEGREIENHFEEYLEPDVLADLLDKRGKFFRRVGSPVTPEQVRASGNTTTSPAKDVSWSELFDHDSKVLQHVYAHPSLYADILEGRTLEVEKIEAAEIPKPQPVDPNQLPQMIAASATDPTQRDAVREALKLARRKPVNEELEDAYMQETENLLKAHKVELEKPYKASNQRYRTQNLARTQEILEKVWESVGEEPEPEQTAQQGTDSQPDSQVIDPSRLPTMIGDSLTNPRLRDTVIDMLKPSRYEPLGAAVEYNCMLVTEELVDRYSVPISGRYPYKPSNSRYHKRNFERTPEILERVWESYDVCNSTAPTPYTVTEFCNTIRAEVQKLHADPDTYSWRALRAEIIAPLHTAHNTDDYVAKTLLETAKELNSTYDAYLDWYELAEAEKFLGEGKPGLSLGFTRRALQNILATVGMRNRSLANRVENFFLQERWYDPQSLTRLSRGWVEPKDRYYYEPRDGEIVLWVLREMSVRRGDKDFKKLLLSMEEEVGQDFCRLMRQVFHISMDFTQATGFTSNLGVFADAAELLKEHQRAVGTQAA